MSPGVVATTEDAERTERRRNEKPPENHAFRVFSGFRGCQDTSEAFVLELGGEWVTLAT